MRTHDFGRRSGLRWARIVAGRGVAMAHCLRERARSVSRHALRPSASLVGSNLQQESERRARNRPRGQSLVDRDEDAPLDRARYSIAGWLTIVDAF